MKNYHETASTVLKLVGGEKNVAHLEHCSTRLRFTLADPAKADVEKLKKTPGVMTVIASGAQCQVVIGNDVIEVYDELMKMGKFQAAAPVSGGQKVSIGATVLDYVVGIFQPLVPAIAGAGILKAMLTLLSTFGIMTSDMVFYQVIAAVADAALYFLPVMVAYTTASKFGSNKLVAVALAGAMILPATTNLLSTEGGAQLFGITLQKIAYTYQVFPAILSVIFVAYLEKFVTKWCPKPIRVFFVPMVCFLIGFPVALLVLGPLGYNIGALLTKVILGLYGTLGWLAVAILAGILPFMISMGMHKALVPYAVASIADPGFEMLYMPASLAHNIAESGACFGVAVRTKDNDLRSAAISGGISALFGITEPALYGVTLQNKGALGSVCAGGFIAGLVVGLAKLKAFVAMGPGLAGMAMFIDPANPKNIMWGFIGLAIALVATFAFTMIFYKEEKASEEVASENAEVLSSPLTGKAVALSEVKDEVFATGVLGDGIAVIPSEGVLCAPADGVVELVYDTKHAVSIKTTAGAEILMHIGMDTVQLEGKGFESQVSVGQVVKKGQPLMKFDMKAISEAGYDLTTPMIITNGDEFKVVSPKTGDIHVGDDIVSLEVL